MWKPYNMDYLNTSFKMHLPPSAWTHRSQQKSSDDSSTWTRWCNSESIWFWQLCHHHDNWDDDSNDNWAISMTTGLSLSFQLWCNNHPGTNPTVNLQKHKKKWPHKFLLLDSAIYYFICTQTYCTVQTQSPGFDQEKKNTQHKRHVLISEEYMFCALLFLCACVV